MLNKLSISWRIEQVLLVLLGLGLAVYLPRYIEPGSASIYVLIGGIVGTLVARAYGMIGLLVLIAATTWYPVGAGPLGRFIPERVMSTPSLGGLFILVTGVLTLGRQLSSTDRDTRLNVLMKVILIAGLGWAMTIFAARPSDTLSTFMRLLSVMLLFGLCLCYVKTSRQAVVLCWVVVFSTAISVFIVYLGQYVVKLPISVATYGPTYGTLGQTRLLGSYILPGALAVSYWAPTASGVISLTLMLPITYWLARKPQAGFTRLLLVGLIALLGVIILQTGGRGGWLGVIAGAVVIGVVGTKFRVWQGSRFAIQAGVFIALCAAIIVIQFARDHELITRAARMLSPAEDSAIQARFGFWQTSLSLMVQHPLGIGFSGLQYQYIGYYEHNLFLFMVDGTGPFGLIAFLWLWGWITSRCLRVIRVGAHEERLIALAGLGCLAALFVSGFSEAFAIWNEVSWIVLGSAVALSYRGSHLSQEESLVHGPEREGVERVDQYH